MQIKQSKKGTFLCLLPFALVSLVAVGARKSVASEAANAVAAMRMCIALASVLLTLVIKTVLYVCMVLVDHLEGLLVVELAAKLVEAVDLVGLPAADVGLSPRIGRKHAIFALHAVARMTRCAMVAPMVCAIAGGRDLAMNAAALVGIALAVTISQVECRLAG